VNTALNAIEAAQEPRIVNAYLEGERTIHAQLSDSITLPFGTSGVTLTDTTTGQAMRVVSVDMPWNRRVVLVGDLQHLFGTQGDWNPRAEETRLKRVHANLYQFTGFLPAGHYKYKLAFDGDWDEAFPSEDISLTVPFGGATVTFSYVPFDAKSKQQKVCDSLNAPTEILPLSSAGLQLSVVQIQVSEKLDITHTHRLTMKGYQACNVIARNVLGCEDYVYSGADLGNTYSREATRFRLWAPTASAVQVLLYSSESGPQTRQIALERSEKGTWYTEVRGDLENWYYLYQVTVYEATQFAVDPYVRALAVNATRGMIVDLQKTDPEGWERESYQTLANPVDAIIYEVHVRDFSIDATSRMTNKGKYLAFTERGTKGPHEVTTGVDSLKELGVTHVQVLPVEDFASVDEIDPRQYNWGYDPRCFNVPEGAYASTPYGTARITEYKRMIQSLHASQLGIIMDVVYNHTFGTHVSDFDKIVPQYYYRTNDAGYYTNGSGVGNELATERPMVQNFVRASVQYWVEEYHVDGFRFDLMALLGVDTMHKVEQDLRALNPHVLLYGEPWTGGGSALPGKQLLTKGQQRGMGIGVFNDDIRNSLIGGVFEATSVGFATGAAGQVDAVKRSVAGSIDDFAARPGETINYVTSHDNRTLWDKIASSKQGASEAERIKMDKLAQAVVFTSQGVAFMQGGEEFLRSKGGDDNSYKSGDEVNRLDWARKAQYQNVFHYYASLIWLRKNHPAFRMTSADAIRRNLTFLESPSNTVQFSLDGRACGDTWDKIIVIYNPNSVATTFSLPEGSWHIIANQDQIGATTISQAVGIVIAPAISCLILCQSHP